MLSSVPKDTEEYKAWCAKKAARLDALIDKVTDEVNFDDIYNIDNVRHVKDDEEGNLEIVPFPPSNDVLLDWAEWIYEIDLDNQVFHVDSEPLFRLDHLPPPEIFLKSIRRDSYRHRACAHSTPEEYRYNWTASPPMVDAKLNELYHSLFTPAQAGLPAHEVCGLPEHPAKCETVRIRLYETFVGLSLRNWSAASSFRYLESIRTRVDIPEMLNILAVAIVALVLHPIVKESHTRIRFQPLVTSITEYTWIHQDVCIFITTHLNDESNRQAAIAGITTEIQRRPDATKVTYGICFSFFHCVITSIDIDGTVKHTNALPFIPSFYAKSPSTTGITALARLFFALDVQLPKIQGDLRHQGCDILDNVSGMDMDNYTEEIKTSRTHKKFPVEVWSLIVYHLFELQDLLSAAEISPQSKAAVQNVLRYPFIGGYYLIDIIPENENGAEDDNDDGTGDEEDSYWGDNYVPLDHLWQADFRGASDYANFNDEKVIVRVHHAKEKQTFPEDWQVESPWGFMLYILENIFEQHLGSRVNALRGCFTVAKYLGHS